MNILPFIKSPVDIRSLSVEKLGELAEEIRETIIDVVSKSGGHLASSLGVVELTLALHYVFKTPEDRIVWDVGHQSYPHKLITGRYERFHTLRQLHGIAGFPKRDESEYDAFETGHSSTSISAAVGMIEGRDVMGRHNKVIAVIGDGAMTAGLAFEGLNHAGQLRKDLIVILNDNEMSISPNVGALSLYLNSILTGERYQKLRRDVRNLMEHIPRFGGQVAKFAAKAEESLKGLVLPGILFEELGFNYVGPIAGHDIPALIDTFKHIQKSEGPVLVHVVTTKGKGYEYSEENPTGFHGTGPFERTTGSTLTSASVKEKAQSYSEVFGEAMIELAGKDPAIVAITAAMAEGTGLGKFSRRLRDRLYDVGIAEPHAATFAAGLAAEGAKPVVAIYSTFLQRSYDEIVHDICLQKLPVVFALDRAGIVGEDGPTHQGVFDISYLRHVPGLVFMAPKDADELTDMLAFAINSGKPCAIRYPRGRAADLNMREPITMGASQTLREGSDVALLAIGSMVAPALVAAERLKAEGVDAAVVNMRFIKPLDGNVIAAMAARCGRIVTLEENVIQGGFGSAVAEYMNAASVEARLLMVGLPDEFIEQGTQAQLRSMYGLDAEGVYEKVLRFCGAARAKA